MHHRNDTSMTPKMGEEREREREKMNNEREEN